MSILIAPRPSISPPILSMPRPKRWNVTQFHRLWEEGWFDDCHPMLLDGEIIEMSKPGPLHNKATGLADYLLKSIFTINYWVRVQMPLILGQWSDPEPDLAVIAGSPRDHDVNPTTALLVVEVSDTSLDYDTGAKADLYAAVILDYWVVDLANRKLIVFRDPAPDSESQSGYKYASRIEFDSASSISPLSAPNIIVNVVDLLP